MLIVAFWQQHARAILVEFRTWLDEQSHQVLPKSPMATAICYTLNQWDVLCCYTDNGLLAIDNAAAERSLRGLAIGRRNWLFVGSEKGGQTAAAILTLTGSAVRHNLDPFAYPETCYAVSLRPQKPTSPPCTPIAGGQTDTTTPCAPPDACVSGSGRGGEHCFLDAAVHPVQTNLGVEMDVGFVPRHFVAWHRVEHPLNLTQTSGFLRFRPLAVNGQ